MHAVLSEMKTVLARGRKRGVLVQCKRCLSNRYEKFSAEVAIHFPGLGGLNKPIVWVFPDVLICLDCGSAVFDVPKRELAVLSTGAIVDGSLVSENSSGS